MRRRPLVFALAPGWAVSLLLASLTAGSLAAQVPGGTREVLEETQAVPPMVGVERLAEDDEIAARLGGILAATGWFSQHEVLVEQGVVFLGGTADDEQHRQWAGRLAANTQDVVAVVNRIQVAPGSIWDLSAPWAELREIAAKLVRASPLLLVSLGLLVAAWVATRWTRRSASSLLSRRLQNPLLRDVVARAIALPVFLLGFYVVLQTVGLSGLAMTVLGGTGILGLVIGFAFRDIAENFLASILLSMQRPFVSQDLIEVAGYKGFVQSLNTRSTLLMTLDGNHVEIPNSTIYKEPIVNFTANPNERFTFVVGIGQDASMTRSQEIALGVLRAHAAVLDHPESLVLVESLGAATVNLRVYFWVDISKHGGEKVRSAVIRLVKRALEAAGVSMPDEAREIIFPDGVPVRMLSEDRRVRSPAPPVPAAATLAAEPVGDEPEAVQAEGGLMSGAGEIEQQAKQARQPEGGRNLLEQE